MLNIPFLLRCVFVNLLLLAICCLVQIMFNMNFSVLCPLFRGSFFFIHDVLLCQNFCLNYDRFSSSNTLDCLLFWRGGEREGKSFQVDGYSIFKSMLSAVTSILLSSKVEFQLFAILQHYPGWFFLLIVPKVSTLSAVIVATISMFRQSYILLAFHADVLRLVTGSSPQTSA